MKSKLMKIGIGVLIVILLVSTFKLGVHAANNWLNFTGEKQTTQTKDNIDEIMDILEQVHGEKLTAEEALAKLEDMNSPGLVKQIKQLEEEIEELKTDLGVTETELANKQKEIGEQDDYIEHLESELEQANEAVEETYSKSEEALEQAKQYEN